MTPLLARRASPGDRSTDNRGALSGQGLALTTKVAAVVAALGLIGSVSFGVLWWRTEHGPAMAAATNRDAALAAARQIALNLQTLDYRTVDKGLATWEASATGPLLSEFQKNHQQYAAQIAAVQTTTTARLVDAALSDLDVGAGKATAVAAVDVSTTKMVDGAPSLPITKQVRMQLELVRTPDQGWKAAAAGPITS